jgi:glycerol-3-phosphate O-acyltransferase
MFGTVEIPVWLFALVLAFAAVTFASHFLFPSVRWFFRRRMERAVAELNKRLERPIEPFKLARRHDMIQRLIYDPRVTEAVAEHARAEGIPENVAAETARRYAREIVPRFSATVYFGPAMRLARWLSSALYDIEVEGRERLAGIDPEATVVFVINHRSNMDYVLVTHLVGDRSALSYAVGEWARIWPLSALIRAMGAYFIRRDARTALYRRILARYVQMATAAGVTQAMFPEGGLSQTGAVEPPKLGLLNYILSGVEPEGGRDVVFVPVALNYDRVLEDRILVEAAAAGDRQYRAPVSTAIGFGARFVWRRLTGKAMPFGRAGVAFGAPLSLREVRAGRRRHAAAEIAGTLMGRIRAAVPVLPVPAVAAALDAAGGPVPRGELAGRVAALIGASADAAGTAEAGLAHLLRRRIVTEGPAGIAAAPGQAALLAFYARSVAGRLDADAA